MKKIISSVVILLVILSMTLIPVEIVAAKQKSFTATLTPTTAYTEERITCTLTISNDISNPSGNKLGSATINIPSEFTGIPTNPTVNTPSDKTWTAYFNSGQIKLTAKTSADCISPGYSLVITFSAITPPVAGTYTLTTTAYTSPSWSGDLFNIINGAQPKLTVSARYQVSFTQAGSDISPNVNYISDLDPTNAVPFSVWVKAGTQITYSYQDIVNGAPGVRYVLTGVNPTSPQSVNGPLTITGAYKTQYQLTVKTNPSGVGTPTGEGWYDSGSIAVVTAIQLVDYQPGASRYDFRGWTGATSDSTKIGPNAATVFMDGPHEATANYQLQYKLSLVSTPSDVLKINPYALSMNVVSGWYDSGTTAVVSASHYSPGPQNENYLYRFNSWEAADGTYSYATLIIDSAKTANAKYDILVAGNGEVSVPQGINVEVLPSLGVDLTFGNVKGVEGVASAYVTTAYDIFPPPSAGSFVSSIWDIKTTVDFTGTVTVSVFVNHASIPPGTNIEDLKLYQIDFAVGDVNHDGIVDSGDTILINKWYGTTDPDYDVNSDGLVNSADVVLCTHNYGMTSTWTVLNSIHYETYGQDYIIYGTTGHFSGFGVHR